MFIPLADYEIQQIIFLLEPEEKVQCHVSLLNMDTS